MRGREQNLATYDAKAGTFSSQYASVATTDVLPGIASALTRLRALDVFCGNGRDARWLAEQGYVVDAMDGSRGMLREAQSVNAHERVTYLHDLGPEFAKTRARGNKYDMILMSAGWMHIAPERRAEALGHLLGMANPGATLLFSLRHGPAPADRPMFEVSVPELQQLAALNLVQAQEMDMPGAASDKLGRSDVWWQQVLLRVPRDNVSQLGLIRQAALQARMSSPHKPVLMYCLSAASGVIAPLDASRAAVPLEAVLPVWQQFYGQEALPMYGRAASPANAFAVLRSGPLSHMADPATQAPLFSLGHNARGEAQIILPRPLGEALRQHDRLIAAGSAAAVDRYLATRLELDAGQRQHIVQRLRTQPLAMST